MECDYIHNGYGQFVIIDTRYVGYTREDLQIMSNFWGGEMDLEMGTSNYESPNQKTMQVEPLEQPRKLFKYTSSLETIQESSSVVEIEIESNNHLISTFHSIPTVLSSIFKLVVSQMPYYLMSWSMQWLQCLETTFLEKSLDQKGDAKQPPSAHAVY